MSRRKLENGEQVIVYQSIPGHTILPGHHAVRGEVVRQRDDEVAVRLSDDTEKKSAGEVMYVKRAYVAGLGSS